MPCDVAYSMQHLKEALRVWMGIEPILLGIRHQCLTTWLPHLDEAHCCLLQLWPHYLVAAAEINIHYNSKQTSCLWNHFSMFFGYSTILPEWWNFKFFSCLFHLVVALLRFPFRDNLLHTLVAKILEILMSKTKTVHFADTRMLHSRRLERHIRL